MATSETAVILDKEGYAHFWGLNNYYQHGTGKTTTPTRPVKLEGYRWKRLYAGESTTVAIDENGHLYAWGYAPYLTTQWADKYENYHTVPIMISDQVWADVKCHGDSIVAVRADGTLWSVGQPREFSTGRWQANERFMQIGNDDDWKAVAYMYHGVAGAIKTDGTMWTWGNNNYGVLGRPTDEYSNVPMKISELRFKYVTHGQYNVFAIDYEGNLWAWGYNGYSLLGITGTTNYAQPVKTIFPAGVKIKKVATTYYGVIALDETGQLWGWGYSAWNAIYNGTGTKNKPEKIEGYDNVDDIMATYYSTLIRLKNGEIHTSGSNTHYLVQSEANVVGTNYMRQKTTAFDHIDFDSLSSSLEIETNEAHTLILHNQAFKRIKPGSPLIAHEADIAVPIAISNTVAENGPLIETSSHNWIKHQAFNDLYPSKGNNSYWYSREDDRQPWIQFSLDKPMVLEKYFIAGPWDTASIQYMPTAWRIFASNDGYNWTLIEREEAIYNWEPRIDKTFKFYNKLPFKHYRFVVDNLDATHVRIYQFKMISARAKIMPTMPEWEFVSNDLPVTDVFKDKGNSSFDLEELDRHKRLSELELMTPDSADRKSFTLAGTTLKKGVFPTGIRLEEI